MAEDLSQTLASTLSVGSMTRIKPANISMTVMKKKKMSENTSSDWVKGNMKVSLPDQPNIAEDDSFTSYDNLDGR